MRTAATTIDANSHTSRKTARPVLESGSMKTFGIYAIAALALVLGASLAASALSIEGEPVRVTHRNSGPRYEIGETERAKSLLKGQPSTTPQPNEAAESSREEGAGGGSPAAPGDELPAVGHVAIRRVFLFPVMRPGADWPHHPETPAVEGTNGHPSLAGREQEGPAEPPMLFAKPFWPFMTPGRPSPASHQSDDERPHIIRHLFGADQASRSPSADQDQDRPAEREQAPQRPLFDPLQLMMDMMHQAVSGQLGPNQAPKDLSNSNNNNDDKERETGAADNSPAETNDERPMMPGLLGPSLFRPMKPGSQNETSEDVVEIEGKKYLRKTLISRHVGDNIVFMTRRLIFIPLNETADSDTTTTDTVATGAPAASTEAPTTPTNNGPESDEIPAVHRVGNNKPARGEPQPETAGEPEPKLTSAPAEATTPTTTTSTTTTEAPTRASVQTEANTQPPATSSAGAGDQPTGGEPKPEERPSMRPSAAERLVEAPKEQPKPSSSS